MNTETEVTEEVLGWALAAMAVGAAVGLAIALARIWPW